MSPVDSSPRTAPNEFRMPSLGADMQFGTVVAWVVKPGDHVKRGDVVAEVETEKGVFEVEIGSDGVVDTLAVEKGTKVPVGTLLARLRADGAAPSAEAPVVVAPTAISRTPPYGVRASPLARKIAEATGVDLAHVTGTGPSGAITKADVERAAAPATRAVAPAVAPVAQPAAPPVAAPSDAAAIAMRHAVAAAVARSKREIPHYYLAGDINLGPAVAWLSEKNQARAIADRILPAAILLKSVALALRKYPGLNGFWTDGAHHSAEAIHLGVAISLRGGGLIAPAIHDADRLPIDGLMHALSDLVRRARTGGLRGSEMTDATITVSNLGDEGTDSVFGIIYPPQVALVGFGRIVERPWAERGLLGVRPIVTVTLAADHRATDGHYGGRFLAEIDRLLQAPESL